MNWLAFCQWSLLVGWVLGFFMKMAWAVNGREALKPSGFLGVFITIVWAFFSALIWWRSGAVSTILGTP